MIKVIAKNYIKKDKIEEVLQATKELIEATVKEEGCIKYEMYQDIKDESILTMMEEWESMDALKNHSNSEHYRRIVPIIGEYSEKAAETNLYKKVI
ncbi:putative quinol monooxygenase [Anaeromicropila herbilytica]|uniref:Antibiotic biosynthesis monooxygenase n=1 Tax=Anaeromicropila herbilytica TaxID=2785025 RepID=A0A7R7IDJ4_9FIRM|nr:putative quinol monooxygenase [Anaeromicropila herbilytica]BCN31773.1 antibiotic biosynthesis monooxygenase [Anaeromicropila herbilytica]